MDREGFREHGARLIHQTRTQLVMPVFALTRNLAVQLGDLTIHKSPTPREFCFGISRAVQVFELGFVAPEPSGIVDVLKAAIVTLHREKMLDAPIKANGAIPTSRHGFAVDGDRDVPLAVTMHDFARLRCAFVTHAPSHPDVAHTRQTQLAVLAVFARHQSPSVAVRFVPPTREAVEGFEPGVSGFLIGFDTPEKRLKSQVHPVQGDLTRLCVQSPYLAIFLTQTGQVSALLFLAKRDTLKPPSQSPLLQEGIVQTHVRAFHIPHRGFLPRCGIQTIRHLALHLARGRLEPFESFNLCFHDAYINLVIMKTQELNKLYHCIYRLDYHLVIVTKYRRKCLTEEMRVRAREIFEATLNKLCRRTNFGAVNCSKPMASLINLSPST